MYTQFYYALWFLTIIPIFVQCVLYQYDLYNKYLLIKLFSAAWCGLLVGISL